MRQLLSHDVSCALTHLPLAPSGEGQGAIILPSEDELTVLYASCVVCSTIWVIAMPLVFK